MGLSLDAELRKVLGDDWVDPKSPGYEVARHVFNGAIDRRPRGVAYCESVDDVQRVLEVLQEHEVRATVRSSGHNVAGRAVADECVVIDLSRMKAVECWPEARQAKAEAGVTWGEFDAITQEAQLATTGGTVTSTGLPGLTLGGGIGWLLPTLGLTCDNLGAATVVTTAGERLRVTEEAHPEIMWALRGGGFGLGIVVDMTYKLSVVPHVIGGAVTYAIDDAEAVLQYLAQRLPSLPREVMVSPALLRINGAPLLEVDVAINGNEAHNRAFLDALPSPRKVAPYSDTVRKRSYCEMQTLLDNPFRRGMGAFWKSGFVSQLGDTDVEILVNALTSAPTPECLIMIEHYHGAYADLPAFSAFPNRNNSLNVLVVANWKTAKCTGSIGQTCETWARATLAALPSRQEGAPYINYMSHDEPLMLPNADMARLAAVRARLDPNGLLS